MDEDMRRSRTAVSRRRMLSLGTVGLGGLVAACSGGDTPTATVTTRQGGKAPVSPGTVASADVVALLDQANTCATAKEETQGPYWFDVDSIRADIRENRPGTALTVAIRAHDLTGCTGGRAPQPIANCVVEIWHCDAGGVYSGFETGSAGVPGGGPPPSGAPPGGALGGAPPSGGPGAAPPGGPGGSDAANPSGERSDGAYSAGDVEAKTSDDGTYLRGAQVADARGIVQFHTIWPGWYRGRTVHIHVKVHVDRKTVLTTQLFFDEALNQAVFATQPYSAHAGRDTDNGGDTIYDRSGLVTVEHHEDGYLAAINLGIDRS